MTMYAYNQMKDRVEVRQNAAQRYHEEASLKMSQRAARLTTDLYKILPADVNYEPDFKWQTITLYGKYVVPYLARVELELWYVFRNPPVDDDDVATQMFTNNAWAVWDNGGHWVLYIDGARVSSTEAFFNGTGGSYENLERLVMFDYLRAEKAKESA